MTATPPACMGGSFLYDNKELVRVQRARMERQTLSTMNNLVSFIKMPAYKFVGARKNHEE